MRLILPRDGADGRDRYEAAADLPRRVAPRGVLVADDPARFYRYRMMFTDEDGRYRRTHGVIGALGLRPPGPTVGGGVLPHERTMPKAKSDRLVAPAGDPSEPRPDLGALAHRGAVRPARPHGAP